MKKYRIKMCQGRWPNKENLGKYYIQFTNKINMWKNYKDNDWPDDWKTTVYYDMESEAINKISEMIENDLENIKLEYESKIYEKVFNSSDIAKILLKK